MEREIFQIIEKEVLEEVLQAFYSCIKLPVQLLDENGVMLLSYGGMNAYCSYFQKFLKPGDSCAAFHQKAASYALKTGEAYTFTCHSDLNHIVFPLVSSGNRPQRDYYVQDPGKSANISGAAADHSSADPDTGKAGSSGADPNKTTPENSSRISSGGYQDMTSGGKLLGSVLVGPFLMESADMEMLAAVANRYHLNTQDALKLYEAAGSVTVLEPSVVNQMNRLLFYLFSNIIKEENEQMRNIRGRSIQQSKINDAIRVYKGEILNSSQYPFDKEQLLIRRVRAGRTKEAKDVLNDLLGYVLFSTGFSLSGAKARSMELCTLLSRTVIDAGADAKETMERSDRFLESLGSIHDIDTLCFYLQELTETYISILFPNEKKVEQDVIQSAISYLEQNFSREISLNEVAKQVYLNPAYFSTIFKQNTGYSYKEYLTNIRVEEARKLLANTDLSIMEIASRCGFSSQSYFSRVFRAKTGFTPNSFRD